MRISSRFTELPHRSARLRLLLLAAVLVIAMVLTACSGAEEESSKDAAANSDEPVKVAASLPLTGPFAIPGGNHKKGYELCEQVVNERDGLLGRKMQLTVSDNRSDTETVVNQTERFIDVENVDLIFGTFSTLLSFPSSAIAERNRMVYPEPSDSALTSHSRGFKYNFGFTLKPIDYIGQTPVDAVKALVDTGDIEAGDAPKTAAIIYQDDFFPNSITQGLIGGTQQIPGTDEEVDFGEGYLAEAGLEVVYKKQFPSDFNAWNSLANEIERSGADYLFALTVPPTEVELVKALRTVRYKPKGAFFSQGTYPEFKESLGDAINGIIVWSTWSQNAQWEGEINGEPYTNQDFIRDYKAKFGEDPDEDMAQAFTVCQAMANAVHHTESLDNTKLRDWLAERTTEEPVKTIQGGYQFDDKGLTKDRDVLLLQWQDGELKHVYPTGDEYSDIAGINWPMPNW
jgi:branched-chain amino acid transport system substrate-binding protein